MKTTIFDLLEMGVPLQEIREMCKAYVLNPDPAALREHILLLRLHYDDRHEYLA